MNLLIDSSNTDQLRLVLTSKLRQNFEHYFEAKNLSENLVLELNKLLKKQKISISKIENIEIKTDNGFSKTRTVVATANALIFALGLKQKLFRAIYNKEPNITLSKK